MSETYMGIPRREIPWYPRIDYEKCTGCLTCVKIDSANGHDVYAVDGNPPRPIVKNPYGCVVGCETCAKMCPSGAISFPSRDELRKILKDLRLKYSG
jgi:NAD-dependent dihydropyrimidine dehydrogenase PreA subunit